MKRLTSDAVAQRLHYLDWLRVLSILGVFLFHASNVFNDQPWHIKNIETSSAITFIQAFFFPWGMALFFMIAGAGTWFSLRERTPTQYLTERTRRLLVPFIVGTILLSPIELYFEWSHKVQTGVFSGSLAQFLGSLPWGPNPRIFGVVGYHLWFLGFLFCFSLLGLPIFRWVKAGAGQRFVLGLSRVCRHRGGILIFGILPLSARLTLHPFFPYQHDWADFFFLFTFFIIGFVVISEERLRQAIRQDWLITLITGTVAFLGGVAISLSTGEFDIEMAPRQPLDFLWWSLMVVCGWCWTVFALSVGMRFLNFSNRLLQYGQEAIVPFFVLHQPVIIVVAYFIVPWNANLVAKILIVILGSFTISIGLYQVAIKHFGLLRMSFGMKARTAR